MQEYCTTFVNSTVLNGSDCHSRCAECFGPDVDQCYECVGGTRLDIEELCQNTTVAEDVMNIPDSFELLDCSAEEDNRLVLLCQICSFITPPPPPPPTPYQHHHHCRGSRRRGCGLTVLFLPCLLLLLLLLQKEKEEKGQ